MVYYVIGLMSGSSLDGLDICFARYEEVRGKWSAEILAAECVAFSAQWQKDLHVIHDRSVPDFLRLHTAFGSYMGEQVNLFIERYELQHKVHFIASHGHTVFHSPDTKTTFQLGEGAAIAAKTGLPVINDLRVMDVALGGQGAPIVPVGDALLFGDYDLLLNIGGITNISIRRSEQHYVAFDITVANQALNALAQLKNSAYDDKGLWAASGVLLPDLYRRLQDKAYYDKRAPKSLSNEEAIALVQELLEAKDFSIEDRLHTMVHLVAGQVKKAIENHTDITSLSGKRMLISGGGALNTFLVETLRIYLAGWGVRVECPEEKTVLFKEALVMGLIGILRWREEVNVYAEVTGASRSSIGGALWLGA